MSEKISLDSSDKRIEIKMTNTIGIRHMIPIRFIQRLICSYCVFSL